MASTLAVLLAAACLVQAVAALPFYTGPVSMDTSTWVSADSSISDKHEGSCPAFTTPGLSCTSTTCGTNFFKAKFHQPILDQYAIAKKYSTFTVADCCNFARVTPGAVYWQYELQHSLCYALPATVCSLGPIVADNCEYPYFLGGTCNPEVQDDPHFIGAHGTRFDFNGIPDKTFCLISDKDVHINMKVNGYYDERTAGATAFKNGKAIRTWIRELGIMWNAAGVQNSAVFTARSGSKDSSRGAGFLSAVSVNGEEVSVPQLGETAAFGKATFSLVAYEKKGPYDVDFFRFVVPGVINAEIRLRAAHPLLQTKDDSMVHINLDLMDIKYTQDIHGVLGQTYRNDHAERAIKYTALAELMGHRLAADGEEGEGFLDGKAADYESSAILSADCKFSRYSAPQQAVAGAEIATAAVIETVV